MRRTSLQTEQLRGFGTVTRGKFDSAMDKLECEIAKTGRHPADIIELLDGSDEGFRKRAAEYLACGAISMPAAYQTAQAIMGGNFFGPDDWMKDYGVSFTRNQIRKAKFPWSEEELTAPCPFNKGKKVCETHFVFLGIDKYNGAVETARGPLSIMGWQKIHPAGGQPRFYNYGTDCWYPKEKFAAVPLQLRWYMGLKEIVPGSLSTSWTNMQGMIPDEYETPSPIAELSKDFLVYKKFGSYPNLRAYAATDTLGSDGRRVVVGGCGGEAVDVGGWSGGAGGGVGLSLFRK